MPLTHEVLIFDNEITTYDFVVKVLIDFFDYNDEEAINMAMEIHYESSQVVGTYDFEVAMKKVNDAMSFIERNNDALQILVRHIITENT